ncbi:MULTISPECIES: VTT domain-containing protein [unclassified Halomonas]|uniref:TVP38/TMEM64 family protein n=1 Tax=unclassified Halomonas TaxID=2609666 RepID=UPI0020768DB7|nr:MULTISPECIES: VTT domain-containing protein [unclassified Halomonas]
MSRTLLKGLGLVALLVTLAFGWRWLQHSGYMSAQGLNDAIEYVSRWRDAPWMFAAVLVVYNATLLVMFPLTLLVVATGLLFGPAWGLFYATIGTLSFSVLSYWIGHWLGRDALMDYGGRHLRGLSGYLSKRGIRTMIVINVLPLAPFPLTNMLAGAFHLRFRDYMIGSTIGIVPGLAAVILLGSQLGALLTAASKREVAFALGGLALGAVLLYALKRYADARAARRKAQRAAQDEPTREDQRDGV